jgi:hypothetical protein
MSDLLCPYCSQPAQLVTGAVIYPHRPDLYHKQFWHCAKDDAYVGCHGSTSNPLGRLANAELRSAKKMAHAAFDPLWREGHMTRSEAYAWLARELGISLEECHIGMFDVETCQRVIAACPEDSV